ncbi:MAG: hypothetical protein P8I74_03665, partial [Phycisphaerales bacterium]|nr:hypothetical protein [Phycisphaerales bacterium]
LAKVSVVKGLDGYSLKPLMDNPEQEWPTPALTTLAPGNHSLRSTDWHYIRYADGSEELYDHKSDPHEWVNLASRRASAERLARFHKHVPVSNRAPMIGEWKNWEIEAWQTAEENALERRSK